MYFELNHLKMFAKSGQFCPIISSYVMFYEMCLKCDAQNSQDVLEGKLYRLVQRGNAKDSIYGNHVTLTRMSG